MEYNNQDLDKEKEADNFAIKHTFSEEKEIIESSSLSSENILNFAKEI